MHHNHYIYVPRVIFIILLTFPSFPVLGWIYPEHREITLVAIQKLDAEKRKKLELLWAEARIGFEQRLDPRMANPDQGLKPALLDFAAWPAISGDHSISAVEMLNNVLYTGWILKVADVGARLGLGLAGARNNSERESKMRDADLRLLQVDPGYVSRAGSSNVHFMIARPTATITAEEYFDLCFSDSAEMNLVAAYKWYHSSALMKARRLAAGDVSPDLRPGLIRSILADEAFALHFLEDAFSAGHVAGIWGNAALRKGTHDYYDANGLEVTTWEGERMVIAGDAFMRSSDCNRAAETVIASLGQILDAISETDIAFSAGDRAIADGPDSLNVGNTLIVPARNVGTTLRLWNAAILSTTPMPGLVSGLGEIPRFRSELGPFVGIAPAARFSVISGGFGTPQETTGAIPGLEFALHAGLGLDGVLNESGDGLIFADIGYRLDGASSIKVEHDKSLKAYGAILSAIPTREALFFRFRMPFYLVPGDLILLAPIMWIFAPEHLSTVVSTAGQGGLIPWQTGLLTPLGRFQFVLGREIGVCLYGTLGKPDAYLLPFAGTDPTEYWFISMRTTQIDLPLLEYQPVRTFSKRQSAALKLQVFLGIDIPGKATVVEFPDSPPPEMKTIWSGGVRLAFDWRYYYGKQKHTSNH